ncbi:MAG: UDP-3-O-(3-hydroxymyristoyl)glucosamine N-acyltransferase [Flavobacteriales bacterium]|jgi:UDP-3-O-[3-hydroxymyristoyl] glucosamine N-acyltransferase
MNFKATEISHLINGVILGNEDVHVDGFNGIELAQEGDITFCDNDKFLEQAIHCNASIIIVSQELDTTLFNLSKHSLIIVDNPRMGLAILLWHYKTITNPYKGISEHAQISESSTVCDSSYIGSAIIGEHSVIGEDCKIHDGVVIGRSIKIGKNCVFHSGVRILDDCIIGDDVTIQANAIIGSDGFGFVPNSSNSFMKIPHIGNVILEDHVEIGAGTCIDRGTMGSTIIRKGVKLDNLIQVAHNVEVGENTVIAAQTGIAGSTKIGKNCMIGGQVGIVGHISIADGVKIAAQSGVGHSITEENMIIQGSPSLKIRDYKMSYIGFKKLPEIMKELHNLKKEIIELKSKK